MVQLTAAGIQDPVAPAALGGSRSFWLFWIVVSIPLGALLLSFPIVRSSFFKKYCDYELIAVQTSLHEASNRNCDILLFGDSTAETGLNPAIIHSETNLTACNIATTRPTFEILGQQPLDRYLSRNPRPRHLVLQFFSGNLHNFDASPMDPYHMDGVILAIRYYDWTRTMRVMVRFPEYIIGLLNYTYMQSIKRLGGDILHHRPKSKIQPDDDFFVYNKPPLTQCVPLTDQAAPPDPAWVGTLHSHYAQFADHVLVNASPTSTCNALYPQWHSVLNGVTDLGPELLPNNLFIDNNYHLSQPGTVLLSKEVAQEILATGSRNSNASAAATR